MEGGSAPLEECGGEQPATTAPCVEAEEELPGPRPEELELAEPELEELELAELEPAELELEEL